MTKRVLIDGRAADAATTTTSAALRCGHASNLVETFGLGSGGVIWIRLMANGCALVRVPVVTTAEGEIVNPFDENSFTRSKTVANDKEEKAFILCEFLRSFKLVQ